MSSPERARRSDCGGTAGSHRRLRGPAGGRARPCPQAASPRTNAGKGGPRAGECAVDRAPLAAGAAGRRRCELPFDEGSARFLQVPRRSTRPSPRARSRHTVTISTASRPTSPGGRFSRSDCRRRSSASYSRTRLARAREEHAVAALRCAAGFPPLRPSRGRAEADLSGAVAGPRSTGSRLFPGRSPGTKSTGCSPASTAEPRPGSETTRSCSSSSFMAFEAEVAALSLDDIDWNHDRLGSPSARPAIQPRSRSRPSSVRRSSTTSAMDARRLPTVTCSSGPPPLRPIGSAAVSALRRAYLVGAGVEVPRPGSHTLRHLQSSVLSMRTSP